MVRNTATRDAMSTKKAAFEAPFFLLKTFMTRESERGLASSSSIPAPAMDPSPFLPTLPPPPLTVPTSSASEVAELWRADTKMVCNASFDKRGEHYVSGSVLRETSLKEEDLPRVLHRQQQYS